MAKPTLALIPSAIGTKLYSVLPSDGGGDFDLTRATTATRVNKDGLIETVASGDARLNYPMIDGKVSGCPSLLLEPQRSNLVRYSENFSNSSWANAEDAIITNNSNISPNGELSGTLFAAGNSNNFHRISHSLSISNATSYTHSIFVKKQNFNYFTFRYNLGSGGYSNVCFDLNNGVLVYNGLNCTPNIEKYKDDWYRLSISFTSIGTNGTVIYYISENPMTSNTITTYIGDGTSGVYIWGAMLEEGSYPTSYIPTNESTATRDADTGVPSNKGIQTGDISSYVDGSNGVFYFEGSFADFNVVNRITLSNSTGGFGGDYISIATNNSGSTEENKRTEIVVFYKIETPLSTGVEKAIVNDVRDNFKMAISWDGTTLKGYINGVEFFSNSETAFGGFDRIYFSRADNNISGVFHGKQKDLRVYDTALTDAELVTLTTL